jgi:CubicO group peptidase (beta-lactamase class C family)
VAYTLKIFRKIIVVVVILVAVALLANLAKIQRLYTVLTLFDQNNIVENFSNMDQAFLTLPLLAGQKVFDYANSPHKLPDSFIYKNKVTLVDEFLQRRATTALIVVKNDAITFEDYYLGTQASDTRISWFMAKSFVAVLFGMQVDAGTIDIEKNVVDYLPEMLGSGYANVKVKHVLQMSSGVKWDENYLDFNSDINKMGRLLAIGGSLDQMTTQLNSDIMPGQAFHYVSMDTHVIGMILRRVSGKSLVQLLQQNIWNKIGMESDAAWITDSHQSAFALGGLNVTTRDYARFGRLLVNSGNWNGSQLVSKDWIEAATTPGAEYLKPGKGKLGYGYQIWLPPQATPGEFFCVGVYGQFIYINQPENIVIVKNSADRDFMDSIGSKQETLEFFRAVVSLLKTTAQDDLLADLAK